MYVDPRDAMMHRLLIDAGITERMRILDLGCGHGKVSAMLASIVGPDGSVVGVDRDPSALAVARANNSAPNCTFAQASIDALPESLGTFDAAVARRVLMYVRDPVSALRSVRDRVRTGGAVILQEIDTSMVPRSNVPVPLHERVYQWVWSMVEREGANPRIGLDFPRLFSEASLALEDHRFEAVAQTAERRLPTAIMVRAVMHRMIEQGVATEQEIDIETLDARLEQELRETRATFIGDVLVGAIARA